MDTDGSACWAGLVQRRAWLGLLVGLSIVAAACSSGGDQQVVVAESDCVNAAPVLRGESDALPQFRATLLGPVGNLLAASREPLLVAFGAVDARVVERNGYVWTDGRTTRRVDDFQIEVLLPDLSACPTEPVFWGGVPILFNLAER